MSDAPAAPATSPSAPAASPSSPAPSAPAAAAEGSASAASAPVSKTRELPYQDAPAAADPAATESKTPAEKPLTEAQKVKLKSKVNGKEIEREYTQEELQLYVQKGLGAEEKFSEAAQIRKTFQSFMDAVKENPFEAFKDPAFKDLNFRDLVIQSLQKEFEAEELQKQDPRAYELQTAQAELEKYRQKEAQAKEAAARAAQEEQDRRMWAETHTQWVASLEKSGLGDSPALIRQMLEIGRDFLDAGLDLQPDLLVSELKDRLAKQHKHTLGGLKGEKLLSFLGDDVVNEILRFKVEQFKASKPAQEPIKPAEPVQNTDESDGESKIDAKRALRDMFSFSRT